MGARFSWEVLHQRCMFFCFFPLPSGPSLTHPGTCMVGKISLLFTSKLTNLSLIVNTDDITSGRRDGDPHGQLWAVQGQMC